jgi:Protein of unknown function (DUF1761)
MNSPRIRQNYLAILVAGVACFLFEVAWYTLFLDVWLKGIGHDRAWLEHTGVNPILQWLGALLAETLIAALISGFTQLTGTQTAARGVKIAVSLWAGVVIPISAVADIFAAGSYASFAINAGFWLIGMAVMGAIVGAWKKK